MPRNIQPTAVMDGTTIRADFFQNAQKKSIPPIPFHQ